MRNFNIRRAEGLGRNWIEWRDDECATALEMSEATGIKVHSITGRAESLGINPIAGRGRDALYRIKDIKNMWANRWIRKEKTLIPKEKSLTI